MITVLLVDDERMSRQAVRMLLACESDVDIVGEAMNAGEALELAQKLTPNVVIMDVKMPGMDGVAAAAILKDSAPASAVVMLSLYDDAATRARSIDAGAAAFVPKHSSPDVLLATIRGVMPAPSCNRNSCA